MSALVSHEISSNLRWRHASGDVPFMKQINLYSNCCLLECPSCCPCVWAALLALHLASSFPVPLFVWKNCVVFVSSGVFQVFCLIYHVLQEEQLANYSLTLHCGTDLIWAINESRLEKNLIAPSHSILCPLGHESVSPLVTTASFLEGNWIHAVWPSRHPFSQISIWYQIGI